MGYASIDIYGNKKIKIHLLKLKATDENSSSVEHRTLHADEAWLNALTESNFSCRMHDLVKSNSPKIVSILVTPITK